MENISKINGHINMLYQSSFGAINSKPKVTPIFSNNNEENNQKSIANKLNTQYDTNEAKSTDKSLEYTNKEKSVAGKELSAEETKKIEKLRKRDREVKAHEQAHLMSAGMHAKGGVHFEYATGPDGRQYAKSGHVNIDTSPEQDPEKTIAKAQAVQRAALAPNDPSSQDRKVAMQAAQMESEARIELAKERQAAFSEKMEGVGELNIPRPEIGKTKQEFKAPKTIDSTETKSQEANISQIENEENVTEAGLAQKGKTKESMAADKIDLSVGLQTKNNEIKVKAYKHEMLTQFGNFINLLS